MAPGYARTIRENIFYEYAELISRSAYRLLQRGFITERFQKLRNEEITISYLGDDAETAKVGNAEEFMG